MRLSYYPLAELDVVEAAKYYDANRPGLGAEFLDSVDTAIESIRQSPQQWVKFRGETRRRSVGRFPYAIEYQIIHNEVWILVVKHHSRAPDFGADREPSGL